MAPAFYRTCVTTLLPSQADQLPPFELYDGDTSSGGRCCFETVPALQCKGSLSQVIAYVILKSYSSTMARHRVVSVKGSHKKGNKQAAKEELPSDDEIDKFHKLKDKLSLNPSEDEISEDEEGASEEEAVYNLSESEEDSEEEDDEEDDDDEADTGRLAERMRPLIIAPFNFCLSCWGLGLAVLGLPGGHIH